MITTDEMRQRERKLALELAETHLRAWLMGHVHGSIPRIMSDLADGRALSLLDALGGGAWCDPIGALYSVGVGPLVLDVLGISETSIWRERAEYWRERAQRAQAYADSVAEDYGYLLASHPEYEEE